MSSVEHIKVWGDMVPTYGNQSLEVRTHTNGSVDVTVLANTTEMLVTLSPEQKEELIKFLKGQR